MATQLQSTSMGLGNRRRSTALDLEQWTGRYHAEVIDGEIVEKALPSGEHANVEAALSWFLRNYFDRVPGAEDRPGGWWILVEATVELRPHDVFQPDLSGWRRDRTPDRPRGHPVRIRPDWVCEVLSPSNARYDLSVKLATYAEVGVGHYWVVDPANELVTAYRHQAGAYLVAQVARRGERIRLEPFAAVELAVGVLFGDEPDD